jgi:hypothetical protein
MQLPEIRKEIETRRLRIALQRKEIRDLERAGISTVSAHELLTRMLAKVAHQYFEGVVAALVWRDEPHYFGRERAGAILLWALLLNVDQM